MRTAAILLMLTATPTAGQDKPVTEKQVRRDCSFDALRYCGVDVRHYVIAPNAENRSAIVNCMLFNRDKLQAMCARHLRF